MRRALRKCQDGETRRHLKASLREGILLITSHTSGHTAALMAGSSHLLRARCIPGILPSTSCTSSHFSKPPGDILLSRSSYTILKMKIQWLSEAGFRTQVTQPVSRWRSHESGSSPGPVAHVGPGLCHVYFLMMILLKTPSCVPVCSGQGHNAFVLSPL